MSAVDHEYEQLIRQVNVILPPTHIKLGALKNFVKVKIKIEKKICIQKVIFPY